MVKFLPARHVPPRDRALEGLGHIIGVNVVHELGTEPRDPQRLPGRKRVPNAGVEIAQGPDRMPSRPDDVPGMQ
jgi:hypothetical protein